MNQLLMKWISVLLVEISYDKWIKIKQTIIIFPIIIVVIISILVSIVFVFNNTNTIDYESKLEEAQKYVDEMDYKKLR